MSEEHWQTLSNKELRSDISALLFSLVPLSPELPSDFLISPCLALFLLPSLRMFIDWGFIRQHHLMCLLSCAGLCWRYCKLIRLSSPPFVKVYEVIYYCIAPSPNGGPPRLPPEGISMAKHGLASWLADPRASLAALMSSLRFDDVANKRTRLIIWPPTSSVKTILPLLLFFLFPPPPPPRHCPSQVMAWKWGHAHMDTNKRSSRAFHPWKDSVQDFTASRERQSQMTEASWTLDISH